MSGGGLAAVQQADGTRVSYTYDSAGRMTKIQDPLLNVVTISYDSAERVGTITRPDASTEEFSAFQEQGWTNSGTSGSPAPAALLAASAATYTDPNGNVTALRPDWYGLGMTGVAVDALGDVATYDLNSNGLPIVAIDQVNRISQYTYDSKGNITTYTYPDINTNNYTYNTDSEPLTFTNENNGRVPGTPAGSGDTGFRGHHTGSGFRGHHTQFRGSGGSGDTILGVPGSGFRAHHTQFWGGLRGHHTQFGAGSGDTILNFGAGSGDTILNLGSGVPGTPYSIIDRTSRAW